jgi:hypothetical protein
MNNLKPYVELECEDLEIIQSKIYNFLLNDTELISSDAKNWQFLDTKKLITSIPELVKFFLKNKLYVQNASVTILYEDLLLHIDTLPMIAKINIPIRNTQGWVNRWYELSNDEIAKLPHIKNPFGDDQEDTSVLNINDLTLAAELYNMNKAIAFHSRIPHNVINLTATELPRIVASFTFVKQPIHLLK